MDADGKVPPTRLEETARPPHAAVRSSRRPARAGESRSRRRGAVMRRAFIFGPIMFIAIWLLEANAKPMVRITIAAFYTVAFIPLFYLMDRFAYRAYHRLLARDAERRKR